MVFKNKKNNMNQKPYLIGQNYLLSTVENWHFLCVCACVDDVAIAAKS